jgi:hypothetical protein
MKTIAKIVAAQWLSVLASSLLAQTPPPVKVVSLGVRYDLSAEYGDLRRAAARVKAPMLAVYSGTTP